jgi:hypothetical protein
MATALDQVWQSIKGTAGYRQRNIELARRGAHDAKKRR